VSQRSRPHSTWPPSVDWRSWTPRRRPPIPGSPRWPGTTPSCSASSPFSPLIEAAATSRIGHAVRSWGGWPWPHQQVWMLPSWPGRSW